MTASRRRVVTSIIVFLLPALLGLAGGLGLAKQAFLSQQDHWATRWLAPQIERNVPFSWIQASKTSHFERIQQVYDEAMAHWSAYPAVAGTRLSSLKSDVTQAVTVDDGHYTLTYPEGQALLSLAAPHFFDATGIQGRVAIAAALSLLVAGLSIWLWPRPYTAGQARAFKEGLTTDVLRYPNLRSVFERGTQLPLLQTLLNSEGSTLGSLDQAFEHDYAGDIAQKLLAAGWATPDICSLLFDCKENIAPPLIEDADYDWWKLLTTHHGMPALAALEYSRDSQVITLEPETRTIALRGLRGTLPPRSFALLLHIAQRALASEEPLRRPTKAGDPKLARDLLAIYEDLPGSRAGGIFESAITGEDFNQMIAHLNSSIKDIVGDEVLAKRYQVQAEGQTRADKAYRVDCSFIFH